MLWTKQYFYYDLDLWLDEHGAGAHLPQHERRHGAQQRMGPHVQRRHHLDAGQVGVPLVRRVGPGVPHDPAGHGRSRLRQAAARSDAAQRLPASERPAARLRMELRRRQSAGARLGDDAALPARQGAPRRRRRHRVPQVRLLQAAGQLHLVGQSQGPHRRQRLRGRLPRARQHRRVRPLVAAAHRRLPGPGRRHGLDGVLQPADAAHRRRARAARAAVRGVRREVLPAHAVHRRRHGPRRRAPGRDVGRGGRLLLRRAAASRTARATRLKVRSIVGLLPLAAVAVFEEDILAKLPKFRERARQFIGAPSRARRQHAPARDSPASPTAACCRSSTRRSCAASSRACWTRRSSSARTAFARCRATTSSTRTCSATTGQEYRVAYVPGDSDTGMFGGNSNWRGPVWMPINFLLYTRAAAPLCLLRRGLQGRMPDRFGADDDAAGGGAGARRAPVPDLPARHVRRVGPAHGAAHKFKRRSALARPGAVLRILPRRHRRRHRRQPPDRLDRMRGPDHPGQCSCSRPDLLAHARGRGDSIARALRMPSGRGRHEELLRGHEPAGACRSRPCRR